GQIPPAYRERIGGSFRAVLSEIWDALPDTGKDLRRNVLTMLTLFSAGASIPENVLPLMIELPAPDLEGFDPPPLEIALERLESAQLIDRNRERGQLHLHPLIQDFARQRQDLGDAARLLDRIVRELNGARSILALRAERLAEVARALESLSNHGRQSAAAG